MYQEVSNMHCTGWGKLALRYLQFFSRYVDGLDRKSDVFDRVLDICNRISHALWSIFVFFHQLSIMVFDRVPDRKIVQNDYNNVQVVISIILIFLFYGSIILILSFDDRILFYYNRLLFGCFPRITDRSVTWFNRWAPLPIYHRIAGRANAAWPGGLLGVYGTRGPAESTPPPSLRLVRIAWVS